MTAPSTPIFNNPQPVEISTEQIKTEEVKGSTVVKVKEDVDAKKIIAQKQIEKELKQQEKKTVIAEQEKIKVAESVDTSRYTTPPKPTNCEPCTFNWDKWAWEPIIISQSKQETTTTKENPLIEITLLNIAPSTSGGKIEWQTNIPTKSQLFILQNNSSDVFLSQSGISTRHLVSIETLKEDTNYQFEIEAIANQNFIKKSGSFKTLKRPLPPPLPPAPPLLTISLNKNFPNPSYAAGGSGYKLASFILTVAPEAPVGVVIKSLLVDKDHNPDFDIQNLKIFRGDSQLANIQVTIQDWESEIRFPCVDSCTKPTKLEDRLVIGSSYTLNIYGDILNTTRAGIHRSVIDLISGSAFLRRGDPPESIEWPSIIEGQDITITEI